MNQVLTGWDLHPLESAAFPRRTQTSCTATKARRLTHRPCRSVPSVFRYEVLDYFANGKRWRVRLHEKGGKRHKMPAHHKLEAYLDEYIRAAASAPSAEAPFRSARGRTGELTAELMNQRLMLGA
jgi:hypothetical protein